ncbi:uncharacterized protein LOC115225789 isoform X2 [Octopus sinensis]|uniref:Uncharacterized protein LOC115225789 isoform X2 n=1 Tax=Octopus sinensis TaxID=2607531 RepID=A0A7E6FS95_9MOLL|nr:uncharacterized protein LOC115225789 isoform X2 [Octopus sinensis]
MNFVFILSTLLVICGLRYAGGCDPHEHPIFRALMKDGELEVCYNNKVEAAKYELTCIYKNKDYVEGDTFIDGCKVCYCNGYRTMRCVKICQAQNEKAVLKNQEIVLSCPQKIHCIRFTHEVLCKPLKKAPICKYQGRTVGEGVYFGLYGIFACMKNGTAISLAIYPEYLCEPPYLCLRSHPRNNPGLIKTEICEYRKDGKVICKQPGQPGLPEKLREPKTKITCNNFGKEVPVGPILGTDCECFENGTISCSSPDNPVIVDETPCTARNIPFCLQGGDMYPVGPIPDTNCTCTANLSIECEHDIKDMLPEVPFCLHGGERFPVGPIPNTNCNCTANTSVVCKDGIQDVPIVCLYEGIFYPIGPIPDTDCNCTMSGEITCKGDEPPTIFMNDPEDGCPYDNMVYPFGPFPEEYVPVKRMVIWSVTVSDCFSLHLITS